MGIKDIRYPKSKVHKAYPEMWCQSTGYNCTIFIEWSIMQDCVHETRTQIMARSLIIVSYHINSDNPYSTYNRCIYLYLTTINFATELSSGQSRDHA